MNEEIKQQWVAALRSGDYVKYDYGLRSDDDAYSALGVLCDLYAQENDSSGPTPGMLFPPYYVLEWAGLWPDEAKAIDRLDWSFAKLADELEQNYEETTMPPR